jgi:hypothetical protein
MEVGDIIKVVKEATEENQEAALVVIREMELMESDKVLDERAQIRNKMRSWWEKVLALNKTDLNQIRKEKVDLVYLRVAKWKTVNCGDFEQKNAWIKENPPDNFSPEGVEFEEKAVAKAEEIFSMAVDIMDKNQLGQWKIAIESRFQLILHFQNFGSIMQLKLKDLREEIKEDNLLTKSLKDKFMLRVRDILTIKIARLLEERSLQMISVEHLDKIYEILNGLQENGFSLIVILKFLEDQGKFEDKDLKEKFIRSPLISWMLDKIIRGSNVKMIVQMMEELLRNDLTSKETLAKYMKDELKDLLNRQTHNYFGKKLKCIEDAQKLQNLPESILKIHYRNLREADSMMKKNGRIDESDLEEKFQLKMQRFKELMTMIELIGLKPNEPVMID